MIILTKSNILIALIFLFQIFDNGCKLEGFEVRANKYFHENEIILINLRNELSTRKNITFFARRVFNNKLIRLLSKQEISYRIANYKTDFELEINLYHNLDNEFLELQKLMRGNSVNCSIKNQRVSFIDSLNYFDLSETQIVDLFSDLKETDIVYYSSFKNDTNSIYFYVDDDFYLIYSESISSLNLDRKNNSIKIKDNWFCYKGEI